MSFAHKIRVGVLRGGPSSEYEASLKSGEAVLKNLPSKYEGIDIFISKDGVWHVRGAEKSPTEALKHIDVVFVALHGHYGEDGKVQHILKHLGIPYTGSESFSTAVVSNRHLLKNALKGLKDRVKLATHKMFSKEQVEERGAHGLFRDIVLPAIVRPVSEGGGGRAILAKDFFEFESALKEALTVSDSILIEEQVEGKKASCVVLDGYRGEDQYVFLPLGDLGSETKRAIEEAARLVHRELGLRHYSESSFVIHPKRGIFFADTSALPELSADSLVHESVHAVGSNLSEFLDHVITRAMK